MGRFGLSPGRELAFVLESKHLLPVLCPLLASDQPGLTRPCTVIIEKTEQPNPEKKQHTSKKVIKVVCPNVPGLAEESSN